MTTQQRPVKENLAEVSEQKFNELLATYRNNQTPGFSGPFIHSAPKGNMFRGQFSEQAWVIGNKTVLFKQKSLGDQKITYYADRNHLNEDEGNQP